MLIAAVHYYKLSGPMQHMNIIHVVSILCCLENTRMSTVNHGTSNVITGTIT